MELTIQNLFWLFPAVFFSSIAIVYLARSRKVYEQFVQQAGKRNGHVKGGVIFPQLTLPLENTFVSVREAVMGNRGSKERVVTLALSLDQGKGIDIEIEPRNAMINLMDQLASYRTLELGNPFFDQAYKIHTNDKAVAREFLTPEAQQALLDIKSYQPVMRMSGGNFQLKIPAPLASEQDYDKFIRTGISLASKARHLARSPSVLNVTASRAETVRTQRKKQDFSGLVFFVVFGIFLLSAVKDNFSQFQKPEKVSVRWSQRDFSQWNLLPPKSGNINDEEYAYWQKWCLIMNDGINNRMNVDEGLNRKHRSSYYKALKKKYVARQKMMLEQLSKLIPPERLRLFHEKVISAGFDQIRFYEYLATEKLRDRTRTIKQYHDHPDLKTTDKKLWAAYYEFQSLYPQRTPAENDAIERRLAWFDMI